ncbi:hypothetical protein SRHO_G00183460 [Serrasalmus rhombeus]
MERLSSTGGESCSGLFSPGQVQRLVIELIKIPPGPGGETEVTSRATRYSVDPASCQRKCLHTHRKGRQCLRIVPMVGTSTSPGGPFTVQWSLQARISALTAPASPMERVRRGMVGFGGYGPTSAV